MYRVTGDKSYLLTDYCPSREYSVVKFTDGNGEQWFQLAYRWGWWTFWLQSVRQTDYGTSCWPLKFDSADQAVNHIREEREWLTRQENSRRVREDVVLEQVT